MTERESPMQKAARQMSEARAYGFNNSGTMAGQVGADSVRQERQRQAPKPASRSRASYSGGGGRGGSRASAGSDLTIGQIFGGGAVLIVLAWFFGPMLFWWFIGWLDAQRIAAGSSIAANWPDITAYFIVIALSFGAMRAFVHGSIKSLIVSAGLILTAAAITLYLVLKWDEGGGSWLLPAAIWGFPVWSAVAACLLLLVTYARMPRQRPGSFLPLFVLSAFFAFFIGWAALIIAALIFGFMGSVWENLGTWASVITLGSLGLAAFLLVNMIALYMAQREADRPS